MKKLTNKIKKISINITFLNAMLIRNNILKLCTKLMKQFKKILMSVNIID